MGSRTHESTSVSVKLRDVLRTVYAAIAFLSTVYFVIALMREISLSDLIGRIWTPESFLILIAGSVCTVLWLGLMRKSD